jgi:transcriptional regulator with XRE-family HTH domain
MAERKKEIPSSIVSVGNNIRNIIDKKDLKLRHVAHDADLDVEVLRRYQSGKFIMGLDKAIRIAKALGVDMNELCKDA